MSHYGRYVIVENGRWRVVPINTGGYEIDVITTLGLDVTLRALSICESTNEWDSYLFDHGALIDLDKHVLIVNSPQLDVPMRSLYLQSLRAVWPGWEIRWAYNGLDTFATYLGLETRAPQPGMVPLTYPQRRPCPDPVFLTMKPNCAPLTVVDSAGNLQTYAMEPDDIWYGPELLGFLPPEAHVHFGIHPSMGLHLDVRTRSASLWTCFTYGDIARNWPLIWPDWSLTLWEDHYEEQIRRGGGALVPPIINLDPVRRRYGKRLDLMWLPWLRESLDDPRSHAFHTRVDYKPLQRARAEAVSLSERQYRDMREIVVGERRSSEMDDWWVHTRDQEAQFERMRQQA